MNMKKLNEGLWVSFLLFVAINMIACSSEKEEILPEFLVCDVFFENKETKASKINEP